MAVQSPPDWQEILTYFRGSELQNYFTRVLEDNLKVQHRDMREKGEGAGGRGHVGFAPHVPAPLQQRETC
jgi:hypothetical protein